jgi:hypothetical protein
VIIGKELLCWLAQQNRKLEMIKEASQKEEHRWRQTAKEPHTAGGREDRNNTEHEEHDLEDQLDFGKLPNKD